MNVFWVLKYVKYLFARTINEHKSKKLGKLRTKHKLQQIKGKEEQQKIKDFLKVKDLMQITSN